MSATKTKPGIDPEVARERVETLTPREQTVISLMAEGLKNGVIAERLGISPKTLDIHRANVVHKLAARDGAERETPTRAVIVYLAGLV